MTVKVIIPFILMSFLFAGCKEEFSPPATAASYDFLVVDGFINAGNTPTNFKLSRTLKLKDTITYKPERGAAMSIEGENGFSSSLREDSAGSYSGGPYNFISGNKYRVHITTTNGKEYLSDFVSVNIAPPIDTVFWERSNAGVFIYLNTHDQTGNTRYYHWRYEQTWKFHSAYASSLEYKDGSLVPRLNYDSIYTCWHSEMSHDLILGSSAALSENIIYKQPVLFIPEDSWQISVKYSVLVKQEAIDKETFSYMQTLKKITEQSGSVFDPQPSTINGNIHCINDSKEIAIGYVYASSVTEKRIFIDNSEVPHWDYVSGCFTFYPETPSDIKFVAAGYYIAVGMNSRGLVLTTDVCGNCTLRGTHQKPDFWP